MDFRFTEEQERFRAEVRDFLEEELRKGFFEVQTDSWLGAFSSEFSRKVGERGWIGLTWPKEYGGKGVSYLDRLVYTEEMLRYGAPVAAHWMADRQVGPCIIRFGSEEQKKELLPRIVRGEIYFGLGMSEPEAGSDLASLKTRAVEDGDEFIIDGQKVWTSWAHHADYLYLVARTDPNAPKHKGISEFLLDMKLPGITVRPLIDMTGAHHFNEIFFDGVRIPKTALIGEKNRGWYQIAAQLDYERAGIERLMGNYPAYKAIMDYTLEARRKGEAVGPMVRHRLAELAVEYEVGRLLCYRVAWVLTQGRIPNYEAAMAKFYCTEWEQRLANAALQILGPYGQLLPGSKGALLKGIMARAYLFSPGHTLGAGTSEVLRNVVALRGLGLPTG